MQKTVKKLVMQIKVNTIEMKETDLPKDFQTHYDKPLKKGKTLSQTKIMDADYPVDSNGIHALLNRIRNDHDFQEYFRRVNANPQINHHNSFKTFYEAYPEKILDLSRYPIDIDFFTNVFSFLDDKKIFFHIDNLDISYLESFSETFLDALKEEEIPLTSFNFFDLKFSIIPNERFTALLALTSLTLTAKNQSNVIEQLKAMIEYDRKDKITELLNTKMLTNDALQSILSKDNLSVKYRSLLLKYVKKGNKHG